MEDTVLVWGTPIHFSRLKMFRALVDPREGGHTENSSSISDTYGSTTEWKVTLDNKRGCIRSVCTSTQIEEESVWSDDLYLQYQMTQIPSLNNPTVQMTPPQTWSPPMLQEYKFTPVDMNSCGNLNFRKHKEINTVRSTSHWKFLWSLMAWKRGKSPLQDQGIMWKYQVRGWLKKETCADNKTSVKDGT